MEIISRKDAREAGQKSYFTGEPCKYLHISKRRTANGECKECRRLALIKWRENNKEYALEKARKYKREHREEVRESTRRWREDHKEHLQEYEKTRYAEKRDSICKRRRKREKERYETDPEYRCYQKVRGILNRTISATKNNREGNTYDMLRYDNKEFMFHIESRMEEDMGWHNHGGSWHIDHIFPVNKYIQMGITDPAIINSLSNLAPMYSHHNLDKSDKTLEEWLSEKGEDSEEYRLYGHYLNKE